MCTQEGAEVSEGRRPGWERVRQGWRRGWSLDLAWPWGQGLWGEIQPCGCHHSRQEGWLLCSRVSWSFSGPLRAFPWRRAQLQWTEAPSTHQIFRDKCVSFICIKGAIFIMKSWLTWLWRLRHPTVYHLKLEAQKSQGRVLVWAWRNF